MNPNRIAQTAVPLLILCAYVALHDPNKTAKMFAYGCVAALGIIIIYTGSRGSAGGALIGCFFCFLPVVRSPLRLFGSCLAILVVVLAIAWGIESAQATERLVEFSFDNRADIWGYGWQLFRDSPVIGQGWISTKSIGTVSSTDNLHSIYVNLLAETGAVGITIFILMMLFLFGRCVSVYRLVSLDRIAFLAMGGMAAVFAHGFVESGALMGSTINSFLMGFSVGLLDRVPIFFHQNAYYQGVATAGLPSVARPVPT
jgi:O-antigen ligase